MAVVMERSVMISQVICFVHVAQMGIHYLFVHYNSNAKDVRFKTAGHLFRIFNKLKNEESIYATDCDMFHNV